MQPRKVKLIRLGKISPCLQCCDQRSSSGPSPTGQLTYSKYSVHNKIKKLNLFFLLTFHRRSRDRPPPVPRRSWGGRRRTGGSRPCPCCTPGMKSKVSKYICEQEYIFLLELTVPWGRGLRLEPVQRASFNFIYFQGKTKLQKITVSPLRSRRAVPQGIRFKCESKSNLHAFSAWTSL